jgi:hypothetical protein
MSAGVAVLPAVIVSRILHPVTGLMVRLFTETPVFPVGTVTS